MAEVQHQGWRQRLGLEARYSLSDALHAPRNFFVGLATVLVVVMFVTLLQNAIVQSSAVFVRLSEQQVGEIDVLFVPDVAALAVGGSPVFWLNSTAMASTLAPLPDLSGVAPRWTLPARALVPSSPALSPLLPTARPALNASCLLLVFDSLLEQNLGIGRTWLRRPLADDETYVSGNLLRELGIQPGRGDKITVQLDLVALSSAAGLGTSTADLEAALTAALNTTLAQSTAALVASLPSNATVNVVQLLLSLGIVLPPQLVTLGGVNLAAVPVSALQGPLLQQLLDPLVVASVAPQVEALLRPSATLTVVDGVESPDGKWPGSLGNVVVLEAAAVPAIVQAALPQNTALLVALLSTLSGTGGGSPQQQVASLLAPTANLTSAINSVPIQALLTVLQAASTLSTVRLADYALLVVANVKDRAALYVQSSTSISAYFVDLTNRMYAALGYNYSAVPSTPLASSVEGVAFIQLFLQQIFGSVMAVLVILGCMLIYSLLLSNVNEKTFEYGMLRALGLERTSLIGLLVLTALYFTVPGVGLGLLGAWLLTVPLSLGLSVFTSTAVPTYTLDWTAILLGVAVGLVMPLIANFGPIRRALSRTLRDSLDVYHQVQAETSVKVVKLKGMGFSTWQIVLSLLLIVAGFLVYYMIPYAFTFSDYALFLGILNVILLAMVIGLCLIASTVQPMLEQGLLWLLVWGPDARMLPLMWKNMAAHRSRNQKTALMFTLSLGFIIFSGASFSLQAATIGSTIESFVGADLNIYAPDWASPLPVAALRSALAQEMQRPGTLVTGYDFATFELLDAPRVSDTRIMNLVGLPSRYVALYGIERNHLKVAYTEFYSPTQWDSSVHYTSNAAPNKPDVIESLYTAAGQQRLPVEAAGPVLPASMLSAPRVPPRQDPRNQTTVYEHYLDVVCSTALVDASAISVSTPLKVQVDVVDPQANVFTLWYAAKARALCNKLPGFFLSSYRQTANGSPVFVTMDTFQQWLDAINGIQSSSSASSSSSSSAYVPTTEPPMQNMWVSFASQATAQDIDTFVASLRGILTDDRTGVFNVRGLVAATSTASNAMIAFFNVVAIINSVLSFFLLWLSFDANVRENSWEFGVLRALGIAAGGVTRSYVYEAVAVVLGAVMLGTVVGVLVSVTLSLQYGLFLELPFVFYFPVPLFVVVLVVSFGVAVLGAWLPAGSFAKLDIAGVIRGTA